MSFLLSSPFRLLLCDLRSDRVLDALPEQQLALDNHTGEASAMSGTVPVPDAAMADRVRAALAPGSNGHTVLHSTAPARHRSTEPLKRRPPAHC
ncbi:hypothetical protein AB0958_39420 [Streptomyces sp. NPDC006655]|uniref:hypothetical protein n=1 Tax=Streptomyces sp. NPDC006655 TaxID=3156898 RepID=UPI0034522FF2